MTQFRSFAKSLAGFALGDYSPYFIYRCATIAQEHTASNWEGYPVRAIEDRDLLNAASIMQQQADYLGDDSRAFGYFLDKHLVGICFYWFGDRYKRRAFWPLARHEAKLVQIVVSPDWRGRDVAPNLIRASASAMSEEGFSNLYARIWHSNKPSLRAFEKAGWTRIAFVLECNPLRTQKPFRFVRKLVQD